MIICQHCSAEFIVDEHAWFIDYWDMFYHTGRPGSSIDSSIIIRDNESGNEIEVTPIPFIAPDHESLQVFRCRRCTSGNMLDYLNWINGDLAIPPRSVRMHLLRTPEPIQDDPRGPFNDVLPDGRPCVCNFCSGQRERPLGTRRMRNE